MSTTIESVEQTLANAILDLKKLFDDIEIKLDTKKEELRALANGKKKTIIVEGVGKIDISAPSVGSEKQILTIDEDRLNKIPELRQKLIEKGVAKIEIKTVSASAAKVTIKLNV